MASHVAVSFWSSMNRRNARGAIGHPALMPSANLAAMPQSASIAILTLTQEMDVTSATGSASPGSPADTGIVIREGHPAVLPAAHMVTTFRLGTAPTATELRALLAPMVTPFMLQPMLPAACMATMVRLQTVL